MSREIITKTINQMQNVVFWQTNSTFTKQIYLSKSFETIWGRERQWMFANSSNWYSSIYNDDIFNVTVGTKQRLLTKSYFNLIMYRIVLPGYKINYIKDICCKGPNNTFIGFSEQLSANTWYTVKQNNLLSTNQANVNISVVTLLKLLFTTNLLAINVQNNKTVNNNQIIDLYHKKNKF